MPVPEGVGPAEAGSLVRRVLVRAPLASSAFAKERMRKPVAVPVLSADVLSSVAYAPEAMLAVLVLVLVLVGTAGLAYALPIAAIVVFLIWRWACRTARRSAPTRTAAARTSSPCSS